MVQFRVEGVLVTGNFSVAPDGTTTIISNTNADVVITPHGTGNFEWSGANSSLSDLGALSLGGDITLVGGGSILTDSNGDIALAPHGTGYITASSKQAITGGGLSTAWVANSLSMGHDPATHVSWIQGGATAAGTLQLNPQGGLTVVGGTGVGSHSLGTGDVVFNNKIEVDGYSYLDGLVLLGSAIKFGVNQQIYGDSTVGYFYPYLTTQTAYCMGFGLGSLSNTLLIAERGDETGFDWQVPQQTTPTLAICGAVRNTTHIGLLAHDDTDFTIDSLTLTTKFKSGIKHNVTTVNAATYDLLASDYILHVTYTATAAVTSLTLPSAQCVDGRVIYFADAGGNAGANNITFDTEGSETINGSATHVVSTNYGKGMIYSDGSNWFIGA
jgi:hypothetical protein